jgi:hypothetical protein
LTKAKSELFLNQAYKNYIQSRSSLRAEFAMEHKDSLPCVVAAYRWSGFSQAGTEKEVLNGRGGVDINSTWYMPSVIFIVESTVDDMKVSDVIVK